MLWTLAWCEKRLTFMEVLLFVVVFFLLASPVVSSRAVGSPLVMDPNSICRKSRRIGGKQHQICRKEPDLVKEITSGAMLAIEECQNQFKYRRWNCSTTNRSLGKILKMDTRETAFVYSMTAAGVVYSITQGCSMGHLLSCSCDNTMRDMATDGNWEWGGCQDNVVHGYTKCKEFMDVRRKRKKKDIKTQIQLHNNEAGRLAVANNMRLACKCHGLSGSCTLKTCWMKMPVYRDVGKRLKDAFDGAIKVMSSNDGLTFIPEGESIKAPEGQDLVYTERSPNFCKPSKKYGSLGTTGRLCHPKSQGMDGCDLLCCGRGYTEILKTVKKNCKCRFRWCCEVKCQTCEVEVTEYRCS